MTKRILLLLTAACSLTASLSAQSLTKRLDARLDAPGLDRLLWGVAVTDTNGKLLYGRNADRLFIPASNTKLLVSSVATALLGPDFTVQTSLYGTGPISNGVLQGDLVLYGRGDPTFSRRCYRGDTTTANACDTDAFARLRDLAVQLRARGVTAVAGDLIGDGSYFDEELIHPSWEIGDLAWWYAAPVSGLGFNDNSYDVHEAPGDSAGAPARITFFPDFGAATIDSRAETGARGARRSFDVSRSLDGNSYLAAGVIPAGANARTEYAAVVDPNRFAALALRRELLAQGIAIRGGTRSTVDSLAFAHARATTALAAVTSRPFREWVYPILNSSQNWYAEMTLKQLGKRYAGIGSWRDGLRVERRFLIDSMQIDSTQFQVEDGSGLAANNLVTPLAFTKLLRFMRAHPNFAAFEAGLPVAGKSGTIKFRFVGTPMDGHVRAKTGSISRVNSLSGFVDRPDGSLLIFSIQANHQTLGGSRMLAAIDSVVVEMGKTKGKKP
ncbi:MAG: D-alanyl-D-alanine carboxypeptidase/D-alanyl-D-alanine-endopeptidase [Gemmatimonadales bacterium]